jgi:hypothetical protein
MLGDDVAVALGHGVVVGEEAVVGVRDGVGIAVFGEGVAMGATCTVGQVVAMAGSVLCCTGSV